MIKWCKNCGAAACEEFSDFCSGQCMAEYLRTHKLVNCRICGEQFYAGKGTVRCSRCKAEMARAKPRKKINPPADNVSIDDILREQKRIYEETGKWLTYGQIVAGRTSK